MTKKVFSRAKGKSDILVAIPGEEGFVSIKSGDRYDEAVIAYKAFDHSAESLMERAQENGVSVTQASAAYTLLHVEGFKTGSRIRHLPDEEGHLYFVTA